MFNFKLIKNGKTAFWTLLTAAGSGAIGLYFYRQKITTNEKAEMKKQATNLALKDIKEELKALKSELKKPSTPDNDGKGEGGTDIANLNLRETSELFNHGQRVEETKWIVDGYMKVGLVNLVVAGSDAGKSTLITEIALAVSKGSKPEFLPETCRDSVSLPVVFYRLEDYAGDLEGMYGSGIIFDGANIKWVLPEDLPEYNLEGCLNHLKAFAAQITEDTLVCIDPATKLDGYAHEKFIKGIEEAMRIAGAKGYTLTALASIHLDEIKPWSALTNCDIKGGDKALQQAGSVTALRVERNPDDAHRYLQCLKAPKGSPKPYSEGNNVLVMKKVLATIDESNTYLHFVYDCIKPEKQARPLRPKAEDTETRGTKGKPKEAPNLKRSPKVKEKINRLIAEGKTNEEIAKKVGLCPKTISRHKKGA